MSPSVRLGSLVVVMLFTVECSGGDKNAPLAPISTSGPLTGTLNVGDFIVPAGQTTMVTGPLYVFNTGRVQIDGTVQVAPGASVAFFGGGPFVLNGSIVFSGGSASTALFQSGQLDTPKPTAVSVTESDITIAVGARLDMTKQGKGVTLDLTTTTSTGTITISGTVRGADGADGTAGVAVGQAGGATAGGNVEIGTASAIADAIKAAKDGGKTTTASTPAKVSISGALSAGTGGNGYNAGADQQGLSLVSKGGDGANGGNLDIAAGMIDVSKATYVSSGEAGAGGQGNVRDAKVDGSAIGQPGLSIIVKSGSGGNGGDLTLTSANVVNPPRLNQDAPGHAASGGKAGNIYGRAGNGGAGGDGGSTSITIGNPGKAGNGPGTLKTDGSLGSVDPDRGGLLAGGGSGGGAPDITYKGGNAGAVEVVGPNGQRVMYAGGVVKIDRYANGGDGFDGCKQTPAVKATNGGASANLTILGAAYRATNSFNGGNGKTGSPGGSTGAPGGFDDALKKIGADGASPGGCPIASRTFFRGPDFPSGIYGQTAANIGDYTVLLVGGQAQSGIASLSSLPQAAATATSGSAFIYDVRTNAITPTGPLAQLRGDHTLTVLLNGKVLVAGGFNGQVPLASAELYDPVAGTFAPTGSLNTPRGDHTATLLPNGKVLISGGFSATAALNSAELYDPASGTFSRTGTMATARGFHTATALIGGKVLLAGGDDGNGIALRSAELYDPASGFSATMLMSVARELHTASLLSSGKVLIAGGSAGGANALATAELYDPLSNAFTPAGSMTTPRAIHTATVLMSGQVLLTGGVSAAALFATAETYDPVLGFMATGSLSTARALHTATLLANGRVLVAGGRGTGSVALSSTDVYQP